MSRWWRAYDEAATDPKLGLLSDELHRAWFNLMCIASANNGEFPPIKQIAYTLRVKPERAAAILAELHSAGLLDKTDDGFAPHNWKKRQYKADDKAKDSYVYVIGKEWGAPVKIGFSKNPWARAVDIQTANHEKLTVLAAMRCKSHSEVELHTVLKAYRRAGEWFKLPRNIEKTILTASDRKTNYEDFVVELRALLRSATTETETDTEADTESEKKEPRVAALVDDGWPDDYRKQFWDIWPNKVAKPKALMKLERIRKRGVSWGTLMDGVRRYIRTKPPDRSWMNPETFLNGERWNDQPAEISGGKSESLASVAKRQADAGISFGPRPTGLRLVEGGDDVRLLSQAGRERPGDLRGGGDRDPLGISGFGD
jgi:hypothetical protein